MEKQFYKQLDGLRSVAVIFVLLSHWILIPFIKKLGLGFWGVNLFFVLSGFLITEILLKQIESGKPGKVILKSFYYKRLLRIFPIYYLVVIIAFIYNLDQSRDFSIYTFTYTLNFYNSFTGDIGLYLSHVWSLCVEEQFYLIWPFLLMIVDSKFHFNLIIGTIITAILFRFGFCIFDFQNYEIHNYRMMPACMDALGLGALIAYLKLYSPQTLKKILGMNFIAFMAVALYLIVVCLGNVLPEVMNQSLLRTLVSICSFYIIGNAITGMKNYFGVFLETAWMQYLGKISYGIYLYHLLLSSLVVDATEEFIKNYVLEYLPGFFKYNIYLLSTLFYFLLTIIVASLSYYFIEKRFLKLKDKYDYKWIPKLNSA